RFSRDWSSDVCSSDLWQNQQSYMPNWFTVIGFSPSAVIKLYPAPNDSNAELSILYCRVPDELSIPFDSSEDADVPHIWYDAIVEIGRASCRASVCIAV